MHSQFIYSKLICFRPWCIPGTPGRRTDRDAGTTTAGGSSTTTTRGIFVSQNSSVTEAPSDEVEPEQEQDDDAEPARVTTWVFSI